MGLLCIFKAQGQETAIPLYTDGVPGAKAVPATYKENDAGGKADRVSEPTLTPFFPKEASADSAAVIICPGGGYQHLSMTREGYDVAKAFSQHGIKAFVLKYRLPSDEIMEDKSLGPLQDAQRAIQLVKQRASEWGIDTAKVGIMGFSAGGHLASTAGTHFNTAVIDDKVHISLRPAFMLLCYPVISFGKYVHKGSMHALLGMNPDSDKIILYSNELQVTRQTPPAFLVQAEDDATVPVENSLLFYQALLAHKVKAEMHLYIAGGHGFGLHNKKSGNEWFGMCLNFLKEIRMIK